MKPPDETRLSPNVNRDGNGWPIPMPSTCRTVIIHSTRSGKSMNPSEYIGTLNYMSQPGTTSSHWVQGREANQSARVVPDTQQSWHAQEDNDNAWGIEVCQGVESDGFTQVQLDDLVEICKGYVSDFGVPINHAKSSTEPGFIGHEETAQGKRNGKSDPGRLFDWDWFLAALKGSEGDEMFHRYVALANPGFFHQLQLTPQVPLQNVWTSSPVHDDLHVPDSAKSVELILYIISGSCNVLDGGQAKAGYATSGVSHYRVFTSRDERRQFFLSGDALIDKLEVVGWYD